MSSTASTLPAEGYVREWQIIGKKNKDGTYSVPPIFPVSRSTLWKQIKDGNFPKPEKLSPGVTAWRIDKIREHMAKQEKKAG